MLTVDFCSLSTFLYPLLHVKVECRGKSEHAEPFPACTETIKTRAVFDSYLIKYLKIHKFVYSLVAGFFV